MKDWIPVTERLPEFGSLVFGYCRIYGKGIRKYTRIGDTNCGEWDDPITGERGGLPPTYWQKIVWPEPPE